MKCFFMREWSMPEKLMLTAGSMMFGMILGFLFAPIKGGIYCGNYNGDHYKEEVERAKRD